MVIYKVVSDIDGKVYVGQTTRTVHERFLQHCAEARLGRINTAFSKAIRKYGVEHFHPYELETVESKEMLDEREAYWIDFYNSARSGYNMTAGGEGGNTYCGKTPAEMEAIRGKIRKTKMYGNNPRHRGVKCLNVKTGQEMHFDSLSRCRDYFEESNHNFITRRCQRKTLFLYRQEWLFSYEYEGEDYPDDYSCYKAINKSRRIYVKDIKTGECGEFPSFAEAERHFGLKMNTLINKAYRHKQDSKFTAKERYEITTIE